MHVKLDFRPVTGATTLFYVWSLTSFWSLYRVTTGACCAVAPVEAVPLRRARLRTGVGLASDLCATLRARRRRADYPLSYQRSTIWSLMLWSVVSTLLLVLDWLRHK